MIRRYPGADGTTPLAAPARLAASCRDGPGQWQHDGMTQLPTPYVSVDVAVLDRNIARMASFTRERDLALRPHAKTHKCLEIARRQLAAGATGLTVATVAEAEIFVEAGCEDLFIAYPLWVDQARGARLRAVAARAAVRVGVDSAEGAQALARYAGRDVEVMVEVDSGHHRSGVRPAAAGAVALAADKAGLRVRGVFTFPATATARRWPRVSPPRRRWRWWTPPTRCARPGSSPTWSAAARRPPRRGATSRRSTRSAPACTSSTTPSRSNSVSATSTRWRSAWWRRWSAGPPTT
ncbi:alanine racemase [Catellatospora coxensis]